MLTTDQDQDRLYYHFINSLASDFSKRQYKFLLQRFLKKNKLTIESFLGFSVPRIENIVIDYIVNMRKEGLSNIYISVNLAAIKHLCVMNDIRINKEKISKFIGEKIKKHTDRAYTREEIKTLMDVCEIRVRIAVILMASSGIRIGAIPSLQLKHLKDTKLTIYENTKDEYITFCTPECLTLIQGYLDYRTRCGEKLDGESFLIRNQFDMLDIEQVRRESKPVARSTLITLIQQYLVKSGIRTINHSYNGRERHSVNMCHGFRKFFTTQLIHSKVNPEIREMLLGHDIGLAKSYYKPTVDEMFAEYEKAIDFLTIDPANRLKREVKELTEKQDEIWLMRMKHEKEMKEIRQEMKKNFCEIISWIQQNPKLGQIKPEYLVAKKIEP